MDNEKIKDEKQAMVPYFLHESEMARLERMVKRMWILCIIMFLALVITNAGWVYYENQFVDEVVVTQDTPNGNNNYVGHDGNISNGTTDNKEN